MEDFAPGKTVVYEPNQRVKLGFWKSWSVIMLNMVRSRELIWHLFKRDFLYSYKQSYLGVVWIFVSPVIGIVTWVFLNRTGVLAPGNVGVPYPAYILMGTTIWGLFVGISSSTARSLTDSGTLIMHINFPHEALVAKQMAQTFAAFAINVVLIVLVLAGYRITPSWTIVFFPFAVLPILLVGAGIGMVASVINAVARDFEKAITFFLGLLMFFTPVIYSSRLNNETIKNIMHWNPLAYLVAGPRDLILYGGMPELAGYCISALIAALFFLVSWRVFFLSEYRVAEKL